MCFGGRKFYPFRVAFFILELTLARDVTYLAAIVDSNTGYITPPLGAESDTEEGRDDDHSGGGGDAEPSRRTIKNALSGVRETCEKYVISVLQIVFPCALFPVSVFIGDLLFGTNVIFAM